MIIPIASLKLDMLIVSEKDENEAQYITDVCIIICIVISLIYAFITSIGYLLPKANAFNRYGLIIFLVPIIVLTNGLRFLFISYNNRYREYKLIASIGIIREGGKGLIQVISGLVRGGSLGQVIGYAIAPVFGITYQTKEYRRRLKERPNISLSKVKEIVFHTGRKQILYLVPAQFVNSFSHTLVVLGISSLYSASALGYYSAGTRLLEIPLVFITANVSKVCYRQISSLVAERKPIFSVIRRIALVLFLVSLAGFGLLYLIAPPVSEFVFGNGYYVAGQYMRCLCIMYVVRFVAASFAGLFTIFNKQNVELLVNGLFVFAAIACFVLSKVFNLDISSYLWLIAFTYAAVYGYLLIRYLFICKKYDRGIISLSKE